MKTIKVIPIDKIEDGFYHEDYDNLTKSLYDDPCIVLYNFFYLHGELEQDLGYDKCEIMNLGDLDIKYNKLVDREDTSMITIPDGIYNVKVVGIDKPCIGYFWNSDNYQRGIICYKTDFEACKYAMNRFNEKAEWL